MTLESALPDDAPHVVLVDDDHDFLAAQVQGLQMAGFRVHAFSSGAEALRHVTPDFDGVVLSDVRMPGMDGLSLFSRVQEMDDELPVILLTGHGDVPMAVQALKDGVYDFLAKPFPFEDLIASLRRAGQKRQLVLENRQLRKLHADIAGSRTLPMGDSLAMKSLRQAMTQVADTDVDVLITGDTGTGKKTVGRALHGQSSRRNRPFVQISCASLPEDQFHAELFGAEAAARPGGRRMVGRLEKANRGTVLIEDVETLSPQQQATLLRVIEMREYLPLGAEEPRPLDIRVMASSRANLREDVRQGHFRADLFYLLAGVMLHVPRLIERREDIRLLFQHFLVSACARLKRPIPRLTMAAHSFLQRHDWPGNVRELEGFAERFALGLEPDMPEEPGGDDAGPGLAELVSQFEAQAIRDALTACHGDARQAMQNLKLPRKTFYDKLARHQIRIGDYRAKP